MKNLTIELKKLDFVYNGLPSALIAFPVVSIVLFYALYDVINLQDLFIWNGVNVTLIFLRFIALSFYKKTTITENNYQFYYSLFFTLTILTAIWVGSIAFYIFPADIEHQMISILIVMTVISGASSTLSVYLPLATLYITLLASPFIYAFYTQDTKVSFLLALSIFFYMLFLIMVSKKASESIKKNILLAYDLEIKVIEANSANRAKSEFLSVMSHEIRTPLNAILGFVQILKHSEKDEKKYKYLDIIDKSSKMLTNVINDILDFSKMEAGKLFLEKLEFDTQEEFQTIYTLFEQNCIDKNIHLINSISDNLPPYLVSDVLRIKQILSNLLSNAIKFTDGNKNIELIINYNPDVSMLYCEVRDEGIGISKENIKNITQAFTQADSSTARQYGGTGLGLSIITQLLSLFNSELKITSKLGKGSSFSFEIFVELSSKEAFQEENEIVETLFDNKKILVAEDNKTNQMLIEILLDNLNINTTIAQDGVIAEKLYTQESFDLILMDINMPNKNGIEAMLSIREIQQSDNRTTPIIALTANALSGDKENYIKQGFDNYLSKPIDLETLTKVLKKYL